MDINQVTLVGRLADNVQYTPATGTVSSRVVGRLIVNRPPSSDGQRRYDAIQIVAWDKHADNLARYTAKGKELGITGEIRVNNIRPQKEGDDWKNYVEVLVRGVSFGRDSNQQKMMKALQGGDATQVAAVLEQLQAGGQPDSFSQLFQSNPSLAALNNNPNLLAQLQKIAGGAAAPTAQPATEEPPPATTEEDAPFQD